MAAILYAIYRAWRRSAAVLLCAVALLFTAASCGVHEFPEDEDMTEAVYLELDFTDSYDMDFYKTIDYLSRDGGQGYDIRYVVNAYPLVDEGNRSRDSRTSRVAVSSIVVTKSDLTDLNHTVRLELPPGRYNFLVWADYVEHGKTDDLYYDSSNFEEVILTSRDRYVGNTDLRDAFRGEKAADIPSAGEDGVTRVHVDMERPLAKFKFISNDVVKFLTEVLRSEDPENVVSRINAGDFRVVFRYSGFVPCSFNMFTNRPADAWTGLTFEGGMVQIDDDNVELGYDYVFVNGHESTVTVSVEVYDRQGTLLSRSYPVDVPLVRNKVTIVRGQFLSVLAQGGIGIDPGFNGEYNYEYK